jgi:twitching motility protein PilT
MDIERLIKAAVEREASDLHIVAGLPPSLRIHGEIIFTDYDRLGPDETRALIYGLLSDEQRKIFEEARELDFSYTHQGLGRYRASIYMAKGAVEGSFRIVPQEIKSFNDLCLPPIVEDLAMKPNGLVLVTGATGMGKTTTLNAMIDHINREKRSRIITIEDPIEFIHTNRRSIVIQREVGTDTRSFNGALVHALRQDPNVICIGEMRDLETISTCLTAAETGHLVLSTLHTSDAIQSIDRIIDVFPPHMQSQVRLMVASCLQGIICQALVPRIGEKGRALALEILTTTPAARNIIRDNKLPQLRNIIMLGGDSGMVDMDKSLKNLYENGVITYDAALSRARDPENFRKAVR